MDLSQTLSKRYEFFSLNFGTYSYTEVNREILKFGTHLLEIPISTHCEIPAFTLIPLLKHLRTVSSLPSSQILPLKIEERYYNDVRTVKYASIDVLLRNAMGLYSSDNHVTVLKSSKLEHAYYGLNGMLFDGDLQILSALLWEVKIEYVENHFELQLIQPVIRTNVGCVISPIDRFHKAVAGKLMQTALSLEISSYSVTGALVDYPVCVHNPNTEFFHVKAIIDAMPFKIKKVEVPSISTTNEELTALVLEHRNELI